jgi:DNA-binding HxlR family transcriptional regulator
MRNKEKQIGNRDVQDVFDLIGGRWRGAVLASLCHRDQRFNELKRDLESVTPRTLTRELKHLEMNKLIKREENGATVVYSLTMHGKSLEPLIKDIQKWAQKHRKIIIGK